MLNVSILLHIQDTLFSEEKEKQYYQQTFPLAICFLHIKRKLMDSKMR